MNKYRGADGAWEGRKARAWAEKASDRSGAGELCNSRGMKVEAKRKAKGIEHGRDQREDHLLLAARLQDRADPRAWRRGWGDLAAGCMHGAMNRYIQFCMLYHCIILMYGDLHHIMQLEGPRGLPDHKSPGSEHHHPRTPHHEQHLAHRGGMRGKLILGNPLETTTLHNVGS